MLKYLKISICKPTTSTNTISKASISVNEHLVHSKKEEGKKKGSLHRFCCISE